MATVKKWLTMATMAIICGVAVASAVYAEERREDLTADKFDFEGRWSGEVTEAHASYNFGDRSPVDCGAGTPCRITLDMVRCGKTWCGIKVGPDGTCEGVVVRLKKKLINTDYKNGYGYGRIGFAASVQLPKIMWDGNSFTSRLGFRWSGTTELKFTTLYLTAFFDDSSWRPGMRSYASERVATLDRTGDAVCTLEGKTS